MSNVSNLVIDLKWEIISQNSQIQGLKYRMSYLARFVMLTLLLDELQRKESYSTCIYPSINQYTGHLVYDIRFFFDAFLRRRKRTSDGKFLETTSHNIPLSGNPICHISTIWLAIAFDGQFWVSTLPYQE